MEIKLTLDEKMIASRLSDNPQVLSNLLSTLYNIETAFNDKNLKTSAEKKVEEPAEKKVKEPAETVETSAEISIDELRKEFATVAKKGKDRLPKLEKIVKEFSENDTLSGIPESNYNAVIEKIKEIA